jgi:2-polyprenyl-3-methyl-5-hydroxy-6-metoxy-1,4-benzoquinol methylase
MATMPAATPCALCSGATYRQVADMGWRRVLRCTGCGLVRADPLPTPEEKLASETNDYATDVACPEVQELFKNYHRDYVEDPITLRMKEHLQELETTLGRPGALLDVGAATGIFMHLARERGWNATGVELCADRAAEASKEFDLPILAGSFTDLSFDGQRFDAISMLDVVEHTIDPLAMMRRAHEVLRPGGAVFVSVPNQQCLLTVLVNAYARLGGPGAKTKLLPRLYVPIHLHYFTPKTMTAMLAAAGFRVVRLQHAPVYLGRYEMSLAMKLPLQAILALGAALRMNARLDVCAVRA